jgi:SAM-dependent methyltransferase
MDETMTCPGCGAQDRFRTIETIDEFTIIRCTTCDLEFSNPMKTPGGDWYDKAYIIRHSVINTSIQEYYHWAVASLPSRGKLLDVGCGEGVFVNYARKAGFEAYGIDFSRESIEAGKQLYNLDTLFTATLQEVQEKTRIPQFDVITLFEVLEHLDDPRAFLIEVSRLLKPDGSLVVSVPFRNKWPVREFNDYPPHHLTRWTEKSLIALFFSSNFYILKIKQGSRFNSYRIFINYLFRIFLYRVLGIYSKGLTVKKLGSLNANFLKRPAVRHLLSLVRPRLIRDILLWPIAVLTFPFAFTQFKGYNLMLITQKRRHDDLLNRDDAHDERNATPS